MVIAISFRPAVKGWHAASRDGGRLRLTIDRFTPVRAGKRLWASADELL
jgi:hypothetical protein